MAQDQDGRVVLVTGALRRLHHLVGQHLGRRRGPGGHQPHHRVQPLVDRERGPFDDSVRDEHERPRGGQPVPGDRILLLRDTQRQSAHVLRDTRPPVRRGPDGGHMSGPSRAQFPGARVETDERASRQKSGVDGQQQVVRPAHDLARIRGGGGDRPHADPDLPHERGGLDVMALYVPDGESECAVRQWKAVVPVATDVQSAAGR